MVVVGNSGSGDSMTMEMGRGGDEVAVGVEEGRSKSRREQEKLQQASVRIGMSGCICFRSAAGTRAG